MDLLFIASLLASIEVANTVVGKTSEKPSPGSSTSQRSEKDTNTKKPAQQVSKNGDAISKDNLDVLTTYDPKFMDSMKVAAKRLSSQRSLMYLEDLHKRPKYVAVVSGIVLDDDDPKSGSTAVFVVTDDEKPAEFLVLSEVGSDEAKARQRNMNLYPTAFLKTGDQYPVVKILANGEHPYRIEGEPLAILVIDRKTNLALKSKQERITYVLEHYAKVASPALHRFMEFVDTDKDMKQFLLDWIIAKKKLQATTEYRRNYYNVRDVTKRLMPAIVHSDGALSIPNEVWWAAFLGNDSTSNFVVVVDAVRNRLETMRHEGLGDAVVRTKNGEWYPVVATAASGEQFLDDVSIKTSGGWEPLAIMKIDRSHDLGPMDPEDRMRYMKMELALIANKKD